MTGSQTEIQHASPELPQSLEAHAPRHTSEAPRRTWVMLEYLLGLGWWRTSLLMVLAAVTGLAEAVVLAIIAQVAAALATKSDSVAVNLGFVSLQLSIGTLLIAGGVVAAIRLALLIPVSSLSARLAADAQATMRERLFRAFLAATWAVKSSDREGRLQELMTNQVTQATNGLIQMTYVLTFSFSFVVLVASALYLSPASAAIVVVACILLFAALRPLSRAGSRAAQDLSTALIDHAGGLSEATRLAEETQVFGVTSAQEARIQLLIERARHLFFRTQFSLRLIPSLYQSAVYLILFGGLAVIFEVDRSGLTSLGVVVLLLVRAGTYGNQAQSAYQTTKQAVPFLERIQEELERYGAATVAPGSKPLAALEALSFRDVGYSYRGQLQALSEVTFDVQAGETVGIIGPSGAGKSTLAQLLLRLREPNSGTYLVNGIPAHSLSWTDWAEKVAYIPQTPQLIYATVADNIRFFRDVSSEDVERAARLAAIHDDICSWSDGYDTLVGPRAAAVSVGQAQRICLARALALHPQILVLDEPTSALDPASERLIQASLTTVRGSLTLFVIAHRLSTLDICDRVMVIVDGKLDAFESFDDLQLQNAYYRSATTGLA